MTGENADIRQSPPVTVNMTSSPRSLLYIPTRIPIGLSQPPEQLAVAISPCFPDSAAHLYQLGDVDGDVLPLSAVFFIQIK